MNQSTQVETNQRSSNGLGTASLVLGIIAALFCWIPFLGALSIPIAIIGGIFSIIGIIISAIRNSSHGNSVAGGIICGVSIIISVVITGKSAEEVTNVIAESNKTIQSQSASPSSSHGSQNGASPEVKANQKPGKEWGEYEPGKAFSQGDVAVTVKSLSVGKVPLEGIQKGMQSKDDLLMITIAISNTSESKKCEYLTWGYFPLGKDSASLKDNFDNAYKRVRFSMMERPVGQVLSESIYPGKEITDLLVFEAPVEKAKDLYLELPADNFKGNGYIRIKIPTKFITNEKQQ